MVKDNLVMLVTGGIVPLALFLDTARLLKRKCTISLSTRMFFLKLTIIFLPPQNLQGEMVVYIGTFSLLNAINMVIYFFGVNEIPQKIRSGGLDLYFNILFPENIYYNLQYNAPE